MIYNRLQDVLRHAEHEFFPSWLNTRREFSPAAIDTFCAQMNSMRSPLVGISNYKEDESHAAADDALLERYLPVEVH